MLRQLHPQRSLSVTGLLCLELFSNISLHCCCCAPPRAWRSSQHEPPKMLCRDLLRRLGRGLIRRGHAIHVHVKLDRFHLSHGLIIRLQDCLTDLGLITDSITSLRIQTREGCARSPSCAIHASHELPQRRGLLLRRNHLDFEGTRSTLSVSTGTPQLFLLQSHVLCAQPFF